MRNKRSAPERRLSFECLESRLPLAADVIAVAIDVNGRVTIKGDNEASNLSIVQEAPGKFTMKSNLQGTIFKVNGTESPGPITGVSIIGFTIDMKGGSDVLSITGMGVDQVMAFGNVAIKMGKGADNLTISKGKILGKLTIDMGADNDVVDLGELNTAFVAKKGSTSVKLGSGADTATVHDSIFALGLLVDGGSCPKGLGENITLQNNTAATDVIVKTGSGNDTITANSCTALSVETRTRSGNDTINVNSVTVDEAYVDLSTGNDTVNIGLGTLILKGPAKTLIKGGKGNDTINGFANMSNTSKANLDPKMLSKPDFEHLNN